MEGIRFTRRLSRARSFMRYIALLRGINVGGSTMVSMQELRRTFEALGFSRVATYINSGNLAFDCVMQNGECGTDEDHLTSIIEGGVDRDLGKRIPVIIREQWQIGKVIERNPFAGEISDHKHMHVLFLRNELQPEKQRQVLELSTADERFAIRGREIYCHLKHGAAASVLGKSVIDKKLKILYTARNWRTVERLASL